MRIVAEGGDKENASRRGGGLAASTSYVPEKDAGQQNAPTAAFSHKRTRFAPRAGGDVKVRRRLSNGWRRELRFSTLSLSLSLSYTHTRTRFSSSLFLLSKNASSVSSPTRRERRTRRNWRASAGEAAARPTLPQLIAPPRRRRRRRRSTSPTPTPTPTTTPGDDEEDTPPLPRRPRRPRRLLRAESSGRKTTMTTSWRRP